MDERVLGQLRELVKMAYSEDGERDVTSELLFDELFIGSAAVVAKQEGLICGTSMVDEIVSYQSSVVSCQFFVGEGSLVKAGDNVLELRGGVRDLMKVERVLLNFLGRLSGIATMTRAFVDVCEPYGVRVLGTRKTVPGWRFLDAYAVGIGGGGMGRLGLEDGVMVKDNHWDAVGGMESFLEKFSIFNSQFSLNDQSSMINDRVFPVVVEVRSLEEVRRISELTSPGSTEGRTTLSLAGEGLRILLDNFSVEEVRQAVGIIQDQFDLEVSGGITLENVEGYARALGEHSAGRFVSVGALTHSVKNFDFSMRFL